VRLQPDGINIDTDEYALVAVEYKQNAYLMPLCGIPHQKSVISSLLLLRVEIFEATKNIKAGKPISYKTDNNV